MKKRLKSLRDGASGRLKDLAGKAKQLEGVLNDLKSRDFIQSPKIQELMAKVTVKGLNVVPMMSRASKKQQKSSSKKKGTSESAFRGKLKALENQIGPQVARNLISTIMKRADEIKKSYWDGTSGSEIGDSSKSNAKSAAKSSMKSTAKSASKKSTKASAKKSMKRKR